MAGFFVARPSDEKGLATLGQAASFSVHQSFKMKTKRSYSKGFTLIELLVVISIIVMLIAPLLQQGVDLLLPEASNTSDKPENDSQTVLAVTADGRFFVDNAQVSEQDMLREVQTAISNKLERIILIKADQDAQYSDVMSVLDRLQRAGIEDIGLITERKIGSGGTAAGGGE